MLLLLGFAYAWFVWLLLDELANLDNHDAVLAEWERTLDDPTRQRLRSQGYRLASDTA